MVNDILTRWAIVDKPRTYQDWVQQYQEMTETLPRQEAAQQHIQHYISKETWILIVEKFHHWNDANEADRQAMTNRVRKATRKDKLEHPLNMINSDMSCKQLWQNITRLRSDFIPKMYARKDQQGKQLHWTKEQKRPLNTYHKYNGGNQHTQFTPLTSKDTCNGSTADK